MHNDVVEHIFKLQIDCARKQPESYTLLYHTRARKCTGDQFALGGN